MNQSGCAKCGAVVVDVTKHDEWHHYHQQQLIRMVEQIERQQKVTGKLIVRYSSVANKGGGDDSSITVDLLAFATYWIGAGVAIGVLAWSVSERRWLPAGAMLLFALVAMFMAYREIRPSKRRTERFATDRPHEQRVTGQHSAVPQQQPRQAQPAHQPQPAREPQPAHQQHQPAHQPQPQPQHQQHQQRQEQQYQQQHAAGPARSAYPPTTQPVPVQPQHPLPSYNSKAPNGQAPDNSTQNGWNRRGDGWR